MLGGSAAVGREAGGHFVGFALRYKTPLSQVLTNGFKLLASRLGVNPGVAVPRHHVNGILQDHVGAPPRRATQGAPRARSR